MGRCFKRSEVNIQLSYIELSLADSYYTKYNIPSVSSISSNAITYTIPSYQRLSSIVMTEPSKDLEFTSLIFAFDEAL